MKTPTELEGKNLGEKHKGFNKLVNEVVANETWKLDEFNIEENDIENLVKIDVASKQKNVDYIMQVLICDDMLYVSRAIKQCHWLVTNDEYSNVINAEYLHNTLFPQMNVKSIKKFTKHIQLNLKDTKRAEQFYEYEKSPKVAVNWLTQCSPEFILQNIKKHTSHLKITQIKKLCEKTVLVLENYVDAHNHILRSKVFEATVFLLNTKNINNYLDLVEKLHHYEYPKFSKSATTLLMKLASERIFEKFEVYCKFINIPTFIKFLKSKNIRSFLLEQACKSEKLNKPLAIFRTHQLEYFFKAMPYDERFNFIKQVFIDKIHKENTIMSSESEIKAMSYIYNNYVKNKRWFNEIQLYQYAPFHEAFAHIKELINQEPQSSDINVMFTTLIITAKQNDQHIKLILQYFQDKQHNAQYELRYHFINEIIRQTNFPKCDESVWNIMEDIMMLDIINSDNKVQQYLEAIIIYKVLHFKAIPELVQNKFIFNSLNTYKNKLDKEHKSLLFNYLFNYVKTKLPCDNLKTEKEFNESIKILHECLNLLNDWDKNLQEYPLIISKVRELIHAKKLNSWKCDLSFIYNKNKSWKKWLFEESIDLCPNQSVFINAIKHDPTMFERYKAESEEVCLREKGTVIQFLRKLKIHWPQTLTKVWVNFFINKLNDFNNQMASSRGVCILLPKPELLDILSKYAPENSKIDYNNIDELKLNLQRCFAKNMHIARPQPPPEIVLLYAKGDYLMYSLPSLLSIYHNISQTKSEKYILEMLNSPVSLQKHAIRFSFIKMKSHDIPTLFAKFWTTATNTTIRSVLFESVFVILCKEKDPLVMEALWNLLAMFMDKLTFNETTNVYDTLLKVSEVPKQVAANFFVKSYTFLKKLSASKIEYKEYGINLKVNLFPYAREIMDNLPPPFVAEILLEMIKDDFTKVSENSYAMQANMKVVTAYLLNAKDENIQMQKYEQIFITIVSGCSVSMKENKCRDHCVKNLELLLDILCKDVQCAFERNNFLPIKMFSAISDELVKLFSESENYLTLTKWGLAVLFTKNISNQQGNNWDELCLAAAPHFGNQCHEMLYEHCKKYFPRIYILFANALDSVLNTFVQNTTNTSRLRIYECLLQDKNLVQGYLTVLQLYDKYFSADEEYTEQAEKIRKNVLQHPSLEVKIHYHSKFME